MSYDGIVTRKVVNELKDKLLGGKIQKITQPSKNDVILNIYSMGQSYKLLISANNNEARINLTNKKYENPEVPPNFTFVLRKHINQAKIVDIEQKGLDRVVIFSISSIDEMGFNKSKKLIVEIMGKHSNIVLTDDDFNIIDSIKRINQSMSSVRQILPNLGYEFIDDGKYDISADDFSFDILKLDQKLPDTAIPYKIFNQNYTGFSPIVGKELIYQANIDPNIKWGLVSEDEKRKLNDIFLKLRKNIRNANLKSYYYEFEGKIKEFHTIELKNLAYKKIECDLMSDAIEKFYESNKTNDRLNQIKKDLTKKVNSHIRQSKKKISILNDNLLNEEKIAKFKSYGDLLAANVHLIEKGAKNIEVINFYENNNPITISLDPTKNSRENVESYYSKSKKLRNSLDFAKKDLPKQKEKLLYLNQLIDFIERSKSIDDLNEIKEEMADNNLIKKQSKKINKNKKSKPLHFITKNDCDIYVGKNSKQNDYITLKLANKDDLWFHVKNFPGSHVILRSNNYKDEDIKIAAFLAYKNSSVGNENKVDVDYTYKKNVKKAKGAAVGMVYYEDFKTITVDYVKKIDEDYREI